MPGAGGTDTSFEELAHRAGERALDKQERVLEELRSRTGLLLAAASLAASFLGREAFSRDASEVLALLALISFVLAMGGSAYVLLPKTDKFIFAVSAVGLYEGLYGLRNDPDEVYRRLAYDLARFWEANDRQMQKLFRAFRVATVALSAEVIVLVAMVSDTLL